MSAFSDFVARLKRAFAPSSSDGPELSERRAFLVLGAIAAVAVIATASTTR